MEPGKIPTNKGNLTPAEIIEILTYSSYKVQRDLNISHESLLAIGLGNEKMKIKYELEKKGFGEN